MGVSPRRPENLVMNGLLLIKEEDINAECFTCRCRVLLLPIYGNISACCLFFQAEYIDVLFGTSVVVVFIVLIVHPTPSPFPLLNIPFSL